MSELSNPFPGMNPWLWAHWHSVHSRFITYASDQLTTQLPPGLAALTEERVMIEDLRRDFKAAFTPDIAIEESWEGARGSRQNIADIALTEPVVVLLDDPVERSIQIVDSSGALITAIELLSPTNKEDERARAAYRRKQRTLQEGGVNLVEIDLLYDGGHVVRAPAHHFGDHRDHPYCVSVWRAEEPDRALAYPIGWRRRLPKIPIPLRKEDTDARLDLQPVLDEVYLKSRYAYLIRYDSEPRPPLPPAEEIWAAQLLTQKGLRAG